MSIDITELDASLTLRKLNKEEKQAIVRLMEIAIKLTEYPERLQKAITELEAFKTSIFTESADRIRGKIEGVKLALSYFEEMNR